MKRFLLLLVVFLALGGGLWLLLTGDAGSPAPVPGPAEAAAPVNAAPDAAPASGTAGLAEASRSLVAAAAVAPGAAAILPGTIEAAATDPTAILVRVLAADGATPAGGALVSYIDATTIDEEDAFRELRLAEDLSAVLGRLGRQFRCDANGEVRVPHASELALSASTDDGIALEMFPWLSPGAEAVLTLQPRTRLQAQVFGPDGRPVAGVPVALSAQMVGFGQPLMFATTRGKDGIATLADFRALLEIIPFDGASYEIGLALPMAQPVAERVELDALPDEPFLLELPPTGAVVVEVRDFAGELVEDDLDVRLRLMQPPGLELPFQGVASMPSTNAGIARLEQGRARFPFVGLGLQLVASVRLPDYSRPIEVEGAGPSLAGETATLVLRPAEIARVLVGRAVDADSQPIANVSLEVEFVTEGEEGRDSSWSQIRTDGDGVFRYPMGAEPSRGSGVRWIELRWEVGDQLRGAAFVELAPVYPPGRIDLGDVPLLPPPLVASGRVVGPGGEPIPGASVRLEWREIFGEDDSDYYWESDWQTQAETDAEGRFVLSGMPVTEVRVLRLAIAADNYQSGTHPIELGQTDLLVQLETAATLRGRVLADEGLPLDELQIQFICESGGNRSSHSVLAEEDGTFAFTTLAPGSGRVAITTNRGGQPPLFVAPGIVLLAGENRDPRLDPIDLRGRLAAVSLRFVDPGGQPVRSVALTTLSEEVRGWWHVWNGRQTILCTNDGLDLLASAKGFQDLELRGLRGGEDERVVVFQPSGMLRIVLAEPVAVPDGMRLSVVLSKTGSDNWWFGGGGRGDFDDQGVAELPAPGTGEYRVRIGAERRRGNITWMSSWDDCATPATLTILDAAGSQTLTIRVDRERLEANLAEF